MMELAEAALWAFEHFYHLDCANAKIHCAPVRFSPITFRLAENLFEFSTNTDEVMHVLRDKDAYEEDAGR